MTLSLSCPPLKKRCKESWYEHQSQRHDSLWQISLLFLFLPKVCGSNNEAQKQHAPISSSITYAQVFKFLYQYSCIPEYFKKNERKKTKYTYMHTQRHLTTRISLRGTWTIIKHGLLEAQKPSNAFAYKVLINMMAYWNKNKTYSFDIIHNCSNICIPNEMSKRSWTVTVLVRHKSTLSPS